MKKILLNLSVLLLISFQAVAQTPSLLLTSKKTQDSISVASGQYIRVKDLQGETFQGSLNTYDRYSFKLGAETLAPSETQKLYLYPPKDTKRKGPFLIAFGGITALAGGVAFLSGALRERSIGTAEILLGTTFMGTGIGLGAKGLSFLKPKVYPSSRWNYQLN